MSTDEIKAMYKATCEICTLAEAMKVCPICKFLKSKEKGELNNVTLNQLHK